MQSNPTLEIGGRSIGPNLPSYIIAEISANHNHSIDEAKDLIEIARDCGADAVKIQTYTPDSLTIDCDNEWFQIGEGTLWEGKNLYRLYGEAYTPWEWHRELFSHAAQAGIAIFSSPFDSAAVDLLEELDAVAYKIASFELVDHRLLTKCASTGKPIIMSTGMASLAEIEEAVGVIQAGGGTQLGLLKCTSAYPSQPEEMNLRTIPHLAETFGVCAGLSDHTLGIAVPVAAVSLGARIVEKHFTKDRSIPGPDSAFSLEPEELKQMIDAIRLAEKAVGEISYEPTEKEGASKVFRRSLFVVEDILEGGLFNTHNVRSIRPGHGLPPKYLDVIIGTRATRAVKRGTPLDWSMIQSH